MRLWSGRPPAARASAGETARVRPRPSEIRARAAGARVLHQVLAALAVGVEGADGVDLVVEQVHPVGLLAAHREQVDQAAAHGDSPGPTTWLRAGSPPGSAALRARPHRAAGPAVEPERCKRPKMRAVPAGTAPCWPAAAPHRPRPGGWPSVARRSLIKSWCGENCQGQRLPVRKQSAAKPGRKKAISSAQAVASLASAEIMADAARPLSLPRQLGQ